MKSKHIIKLFYLLFFLLHQALQGQTAIGLEFTGTQKQFKETKKILKSHVVYFNFSDSFIKIDFIKKDTIYIPSIYVDNRKNDDFILIKLVSHKRCYYSLLSIDFCSEMKIKNILMYRIPKKIHLFGRCFVMFKSKDLASEISSEVNQSKIYIPIYMIPCKLYNGEFEEKTKNKMN